MIKQRGFEVISALADKGIEIPKRGTKNSAGYDISVIHPDVYKLLLQGKTIEEAWNEVSEINSKGNRYAIYWKEYGKSSMLLPTGIKSYMQPNEVLIMAVRSSAGIKKNIRQANPPSIIDSDYYNNPNNEGHIFFAVCNSSIVFDKPIMPIAQGIFINYLITDNDNVTTERVGGIGSTDGHNVN